MPTARKKRQVSPETRAKLSAKAKLVWERRKVEALRTAIVEHKPLRAQAKRRRKPVQRRTAPFGQGGGRALAENRRLG